MKELSWRQDGGEPTIDELQDDLRDPPSTDQAGVRVPETTSATSALGPKPYSVPAEVRVDVASVQEWPHLEGRLDELCRRADGRGRLVPYSGIRQEVLSINLKLNAIGLRPPAYRTSRKFPKVVKKGEPVLPDRVTLGRDAKLVDLHWLHTSGGYRRRLEDKCFRDLMVRDLFDFDMAQEFVSKSWTTEKRVSNILVLSDVEQWQLAVLLSEQIRGYRADLSRASKGISAKLRSHVHRSGQTRIDVDDMTALWRADQFCDGKNQALIAQVHGWERGQAPLSVPTISAKLKRLRLLIDKINQR